MKKILISILMFLLMISNVYALTFPINIEDCVVSKKYGRVILTGWYTQKRYDHKYARLHRALDIPANRFVKVRSVERGEVIEVGFDRPDPFKGKDGKTYWKCGYGNYVKIKNRNGEIWIYAHLDSYKVKEGDRVSEGEVIGKVGSTGLVYSNGVTRIGNHLHIEKIDENGNRIYTSKDLGRAIKPFIPDQKTGYAFTLGYK